MMREIVLFGRRLGSRFALWRIHFAAYDRDWIRSCQACGVPEKPRTLIRMINQWDNADGSIERGYAGHSIFYEEGRIVSDLSRVRDYARLLASVGINAISINNVNVHEIETKFITPELLPDVARVADVFRDYGIRYF